MLDIAIEFIVAFVAVIGLYLVVMAFFAGMFPVAFERWKAILARMSAARKARRPAERRYDPFYGKVNVGVDSVVSLAGIDTAAFPTLSPIIDEIIAEEAYDAVATDLAYVAAVLASDEETEV